MSVLYRPRYGALYRPLYGPDGSAVPSDGPNGWLLPRTNIEFTALGMPAPTAIWLCQDASGNASDVNGGLALVAGGTPLYPATVAGWNRRGLSADEGTADRFSVGTGVGPNPSTTSSFWLFYFLVPPAPAANGRLIAIADGATPMVVVHTTTDRMRITIAANSADGTVSPQGSRAVAIMQNLAASTARLYTDQEKITGTFNGTIPDVNKGLFGLATADDATAVWGCMWQGSAAELTDAQAKLRFQQLHIQPPWS